MNMLKWFNGGKRLDSELIEKIEQFFKYKWENDRLQALDDPNEIKILT